MRNVLFVILALLLTTSVLAGCLAPEGGSGNLAVAGNGSQANASSKALVANATAGNATANGNATAPSNSTEPATANATEDVPAPPDPCATPVHGLDHPCIADGLHHGEAVYWPGGPLPDWRSSALGVDYALRGGGCRDTTGCVEYTFTVAESAPGTQLRVDAQVFFRDPSYVRPHADALAWGHETSVVLKLFGPGQGEEPDDPGSASAWTYGAFARSLFVGGYDPDTGEALPAPAEGTWTLRVSGFLPGDFDYRLRAALAAPTPPSEEIAYPDMRIIPPWEIGFMVPTSTFQPGVPTGVGAPGATCMAEEYEEAIEEGNEPPRMCLRFSMGFYNAGEGPLRLKAASAEDPATRVQHESGLEERPLVQSVCTPTGHRCVDVPDLHPDSRFHGAHAHYHYQNAYVFDLYRVGGASVNGTPALEHISTSGKLGMNPAPEAIEGWDRFYQLPLPTPRGEDADGNPDPADIQMQVGWGDIYDWNRGGNYVDFPMTDTGQAVPGDYVLRGTTDPQGELLETNETNNQGYTWFRVSGLGDVEILERGYGADPWDPAKDVFEVTP